MKLTATQIKLLSCMADGKFHSGQQLADEISVSRTSIWNYLSALEKNLGLAFHAVKGKGTRLKEPLELLDKKNIQQSLSAESIRLLKKLLVLDVTESTNRYLVNPNNNLPKGTVCTAEMQSSGRGRLGREWISPFAQNIYISFLWRFNVSLSSLSGLSLACGVQVCKALTKMGLTGHSLKWPNDILWQGEKLGGILVELQGENQGEYKAVIGIGLNYQMSERAAQAIDQPWTSLASIMDNKMPSRNELTAELINQILPMLEQYSDTGLKPYQSQWNAYDGYRDKKVRIISGQNIKPGIAKGITNIGELKLLNEQGEIEKISSGEVSLRLDG